VGKTPAEAKQEGLLPKPLVLAAVTRDDKTIIPSGDTMLEGKDLLVVFSQEPLGEAEIKVFTG
jgi:Trk K+ transport system NAD-binding subunit